MKKLIMMAATLIMCFAFSLSVMAAPSPEDEYYNQLFHAKSPLTGF